MEMGYRLDTLLDFILKSIDIKLHNRNVNLTPLIKARMWDFPTLPSIDACRTRRYTKETTEMVEITSTKPEKQQK